MNSILDYINNQLGPVPRRFPRADWPSLTIPEPSWAATDDMGVIFKDQRFLFEQGEVVWAARIQANSLLFKRGIDNCPATYIYSRHPDIDDNPNLLATIAVRLASLKRRNSDREDEQRYGDMLRNERKRAMRWRVTEHLTGGIPVYSTSIMVCRKHIPERTLGPQLVPLLRHMSTVATVIVLHKFWPRKLRESWASAIEQSTAGQPWVSITPEAIEYVREYAREKGLRGSWFMRVEVQQSDDESREKHAWDVFPNYDPEKDRLFELEGIRLVIHKYWVNALRGLQISLFDNGVKKGLDME